MFRTLFSSAFIIFLLLISFTTVASDNIWSYTVQDKAGDDYGPGNYKYPRNKIFEPYEGLLDLIEFTIKEAGDDYLLRFEFNKLKDPWKGNYGFSLPLIEIYIDNEEGGAEDIIEKGANIKLDKEHPWNKLIKLSGWWLLLYEDGVNITENISIEGNVRQSKWEIKNASVKTKNNVIEARVPTEKLGDMRNSHIQLIIGSFDPFGSGHFRDVVKKPSSWKFFAENIEDTKTATRVIDTVLPPEFSQEEVLAAGDGKKPHLKAVHLKKPAPVKSYQILHSPFLYLVLLVIITSAITMRKKMR